MANLRQSAPAARMLPRQFFFGLASIKVTILLFLCLQRAVTGQILSEKKQSKKKRLGILAASLPWTFGPYQSQAHKLSLLLSNQYGSDSDGYEVFWMTFHRHMNIPHGEYATYEELRPHVSAVSPPSKDFVLDHLSFIGTSGTKPPLKASYLNELARNHDLSAVITLMDVTQMLPDIPFTVPAVGWVPLHSDGLAVPKSSIEYWILRNYHGLAALAPSTSTAIENSVGKATAMGDGDMDSDNKRRMSMLKEIFGKPAVEFIPHIIEWKTIHDSAIRGYELLTQLSVMDADAKLSNKPPMRHRGLEELLTLQGSVVLNSTEDRKNLFGSHRSDDFVVLLQGGNYEKHDRKGWDTSFQAFTHFYNELPSDEHRSKVHLLIHSIESYLVESDTNGSIEAPPAVLPEGHLHERNLHHLGLPHSAYTIDMNLHAEEIVAAYKKRADVCLHPSKVEGFGMNVLECQAVGTPTITTNFTAMGDFTHLGISVPIRQTYKTPQVPYHMAMPDVPGIAEALRTLYDQHQSMLAEKESESNIVTTTRQREVERTREWLDSTFSSSVVGDSFFQLLKLADEEHKRRTIGIHRLVQSDAPPELGAYKILSGYHLGTADWDEPWTLIAPDGMEVLNEKWIHSFAWRILLGQFRDEGINSQAVTNLMRFAATYDDGRNHAEVSQDDAPILVRTYLLAGLQNMATRRKSIIGLTYHEMVNPKLLPEGMVAVRDKSSKLNKSKKECQEI